MRLPLTAQISSLEYEMHLFQSLPIRIMILYIVIYLLTVLYINIQWIDSQISFMV